MYEKTTASAHTPGAIRNLILVCTGRLNRARLTGPDHAASGRAASGSGDGSQPLAAGEHNGGPYLLPLALAIPLGGIVTRLGAQKMFITGAVGMMLAPWLSLLVPTLGGLLATQVTLGLAHLVMVIAAQSVVAGLGQGAALERYFGWYTMCLSGGQLAGRAGWTHDRHLSMNWVFATIGTIQPSVWPAPASTVGQRTPRPWCSAINSWYGYGAHGTTRP